MYAPHWTIGKFKGRGMFARRMSWGLQDWSSHYLNVLRWSYVPRYSSSSSWRTPGLPEISDPCNNWFPVWIKVTRGYIETVSKDALCCNHRQTIRKVGFEGKRTFLTTPTHDSNWLYCHHVQWCHHSTVLPSRTVMPSQYVMAWPCIAGWFITFELIYSGIWLWEFFWKDQESGCYEKTRILAVLIRPVVDQIFMQIR